jgi:3-oxoacyl-[acyl-carrier protein] reductase
MDRLKNKVAIVTGASKGIGAGIAKALGREGAAVVVNYSSSQEGADAVVAEITGQGGKAVAIQGSVAKSAEVERLFDEAKSKFGQLDILVNNAGVFQFTPIEAFSEEEFHRQFNTNVLGMMLATQQAVKQFGDAGGSVINIGSVISRSPVPGSSIYAATKGAVDLVTRSLAKELGAKKIRVNSINPGGVETEGTRSAGVIGSDFEKQMIQQTPLGRMGQPEDIARVAVFLASDEARWITGELIAVSGGS